MASANPNDLNKIWELSLYELHRSPQEPITDNTEIEISPQSLQSELMCPICLDVLKKTMTTKECLHRFCSECIVTALRSGNKECPTCRKKLASKRSLRPDPNFDLIISMIYPNRDEYEAHQTRILEKLNKSHSQANLVQSINEGIKLQTQNRQQRIKKNQHEELNESSSSNTSKPSNSSSQDNVTRTMVQTKVAKKIKSVMISEKEGPDSTVDTMDTAECNGASIGVPVDEIELVLKPHPTVMTSDNPFISVLKENSVRYIKTTANATVDHLNKYLAMRLNVDLGSELPEQSLDFLMYVTPTEDQFIPVKGNQTLRNIQDKFWKYLAMRLNVDLGSELPEQFLDFLMYVTPKEDQFIPVKDNQTLRNIQDKFWKYLAMRLNVDLGSELPEQFLDFLMYVTPKEDQFIPVKDNQTLRNIQDKFWKVNKPLEIFYSFA